MFKVVLMMIAAATAATCVAPIGACTYCGELIWRQGRRIPRCGGIDEAMPAADVSAVPGGACSTRMLCFFV